MNTTSKSDGPRYEYPSVTVDVLIFTVVENKLKIVLIKRGVEPFKNVWAIPGGFVKMEESLEEAASRELLQETGVKNVYLEQLYTFGEPKRDPRTRVITVAYYALVPSQNIKLYASTDASEAQWFSVEKLPALAFDHRQIFDYALNRLRSKIEYTNIVYSLLPPKFRLSDLQKVYEIILGKKLDKRNFRKRMLSLGLLKPSGEKEKSGAHRPAMLYEFRKKEVVFFD
ncbi:MAG: NUDIX domain-containing protein [Candidatus Daviesbacteria bacterium]